MFSLCYLVGVFVAFRWQDGLILEKNGWKMQVKGDRITIVILMLIFFSNFVNGVVSAVSPQLFETLPYTVVVAGVIALCSGSFTGRALRVITLGNRAKSAV